MIDIILIAIGFIFCVFGVVGVMRMPDYVNRFHATTIIATMGSGMAMLGVAAYGLMNGNWLFVKSAILVQVSVMLGGAISSHALARACFKRGIIPDNLRKNEFPKEEKMRDGGQKVRRNGKR